MLKSLTCLSVVFFAVSAEAQADQDWPQFLGPERNGISAEIGLLDGWPEDGPAEVWRVRGGVGMSGLAIHSGRLVTMMQTDGQQHVLCLDAKTGKTIWQTPVAPAYRNGQGNGPRATPTIAGDTVFAFTGEGVLVSLGFADGKVLWSHDAVTDHRGKPADYGMSCSPLVVGDNVIVTAGTPTATLVAYDMKSGNVAWTGGKSDTTGYSSPALLDVGGRQQIVAATGSSILGVEPKTGMVLWRYPYETDYNCNIATPLAYRGHVFVSSGENHGSVLLKLSPKGDRFQATEVWSSQGTKSVLRNEWQTSILTGGFLYGFDNVGSAGPVTHLVCVNAATGERSWQQLRFGKGNLIAADGKLLISTMKGEIVLVEASPEQYTETGRAKVMSTTRQAPALSNGLLYLRDDREIICWNVRKK